MFPNSVFAVPTGSFNAPVIPPTIDPDKGPKATIRVSCAWLPYIRGALTQLMLQATWNTDEAGLALVQQRASLLISMFAGNAPGDCTNAPEETIDFMQCEDDMGCGCLRWQDGKLQQFCCGSWQDIPGAPVSGGLPGQPGAGSGLPSAGGGTVGYCYQMSGNDTRLVPFLVSSGDVIQFFNLEGAWNDTREIIWNCPDGWIFALDVCGQTFPHGSPDPLPTALHMSLIGKIGSTYYDVLNLDGEGVPQPFTVPPGITNQQLLIVANTDAPASTTGTISYCVNVTNNQAGRWSHTFRFDTFPEGFAVDTGAQGLWTSGIGWQAQVTDAFSENLVASRDIVPTTIDTAQVQYEYANSAGVAALVELRRSGSTVHEVDVPGSSDGFTGSGDTGPLSFTPVSVDRVTLRTSTHNPGTGNIVVMTLGGTGVDPFLA